MTIFGTTLTTDHLAQLIALGSLLGIGIMLALTLHGDASKRYASGLFAAALFVWTAVAIGIGILIEETLRQGIGGGFAAFVATTGAGVLWIHLFRWVVDRFQVMEFQRAVERSPLRRARSMERR